MSSGRRVPFTLVLFFCLFISSHSLTSNYNFRKKHKIKGPIKTLVIIVMENRSFDHLLGWLKSTRPDIDGLSAQSQTQSTSPTPTPLLSLSLTMLSSSILTQATFFKRSENRYLGRMTALLTQLQ
ncbi:hypothetical protein J1N35_008483 [Gossypium stocksii]|uniref:Uncharacterized protein n=1 Tax=Gossypium stocksii TaxID=47602 RepID=A0A9D3WB41_9ROSI|nr:hypothetical protein J1N35_008483 [Gossypium stocksii]